MNDKVVITSNITLNTHARKSSIMRSQQHKLYMYLTFISCVNLDECAITTQSLRYYAVSDLEMFSSVLSMPSRSKIACGSMCTSMNECISFSYNNVTEICKLNDKDSLTTPLEAETSYGSALYHKGCEDGWEVHKYKCYLFELTARSWESSKSFCESLGANLVKVETDDEHQFIRNKVQCGSVEYYWIGARYNSTAGEHRWVDGTAMAYNGWGTGKPGTLQGCVDYVENTGWLWNSHWDCINTPGAFICAKGR